LLMALNGGREEISGEKVLDGIKPLSGGYLKYDEVMENFKVAMVEVARVYSKTMNIIHYMHDRYYYEKAQFAFIDTDPGIDMAYGAAGISIIADSLSAIKYAKVEPIRNEEGLTVDFKVEGNFPMFGNDDDRVDSIAQEIAGFFFRALAKHKCYKNAVP